MTTDTLKLIRDLNTPTPRAFTQPLKSRRRRRQEERDRVKAAKLNQKKIDRLSA
jgi:hypothetical protein